MPNTILNYLIFKKHFVLMQIYSKIMTQNYEKTDFELSRTLSYHRL